MRVVVTGAAGLLGRHVASACHAAGFDVLGIDLRQDETAKWRTVSADLSDLGVTAQLFRQADAVAHCAAIPRPTGVAPAEVYRVNMATAYAAVAAAEIAGCRRFVQASSFSVLGYPFSTPLPRPQALPVTEAQPAAPQDIYGTTKWLAEELIEASVRGGAFSAVSLRMPWIQTPQTFHTQIGPRRRTPEAAADLWAYLDARDAGAAFVAALNWTGAGHLRCYLSAADSYSETDSQSLVAASFGQGIPGTGELSGHASLISTERARSQLGFVPRYSWRDYKVEGQ